MMLRSSTTRPFQREEERSTRKTCMLSNSRKHQLKPTQPISPKRSSAKSVKAPLLRRQHLKPRLKKLRKQRNPRKPQPRALLLRSQSLM